MPCERTDQRWSGSGLGFKLSITTRCLNAFQLISGACLRGCDNTKIRLTSMTSRRKLLATHEHGRLSPPAPLATLANTQLAIPGSRPIPYDGANGEAAVVAVWA